jgi:hypothetical protein
MRRIANLVVCLSLVGCSGNRVQFRHSDSGRMREHVVVSSEWEGKI